MTEPPVPPAGEREVERHFLVQAPVPAMDLDGFRVTVIGLVLFGLAAVVTAIGYPRLHADGNGWWLGVCLSGFALGWVGLAYCFYRRRRRLSGSWERD